MTDNDDLFGEEEIARQIREERIQSKARRRALHRDPKRLEREAQEVARRREEAAQLRLLMSPTEETTLGAWAQGFEAASRAASECCGCNVYDSEYASNPYGDR